jgi:hypothetical protein
MVLWLAYEVRQVPFRNGGLGVSSSDTAQPLVAIHLSGLVDCWVQCFAKSETKRLAFHLHLAGYRDQVRHEVH